MVETLNNRVTAARLIFEKIEEAMDRVENTCAKDPRVIDRLKTLPNTWVQNLRVLKEMSLTASYRLAKKRGRTGMRRMCISEIWKIHFGKIARRWEFSGCFGTTVEQAMPTMKKNQTP